MVIIDIIEKVSEGHCQSFQVLAHHVHYCSIIIFKIGLPPLVDAQIYFSTLQKLVLVLKPGLNQKSYGVEDRETSKKHRVYVKALHQLSNHPYFVLACLYPVAKEPAGGTPPNVLGQGGRKDGIRAVCYSCASTVETGANWDDGIGGKARSTLFFSNLEAHNFPAQVSKLVRGCASIFNFNLFMNCNYDPPYHVAECVCMHNIALAYMLQNDPIAVCRLAIVVQDHQALLLGGLRAQPHLVEFLQQYGQAFPAMLCHLNRADQTAILLEPDQVV